MPDPTVPQILILCGFGFLASTLDAIVGGGGLISVPALFAVMPNAPAAALLATNKFGSTCGATAAVARYAKNGMIDWKVGGPIAVAAFLLSIGGAWAVTQVNPELIKPLVLVLLLGVLLYTLLRKSFGEAATRIERPLWVGLSMGAALGFYEGFFGPGMGSFLVFGFITLYGFNFLQASGTGRLVNLAANLSALLYFLFNGFVILQLAVPMAVCMFAGGLFGSKLAITHGAKWVRLIFLVVVSAVISKFAYDILSQWLASR